jgi:hypothetical protein
MWIKYCSTERGEETKCAISYEQSWSLSRAPGLVADEDVEEGKAEEGNMEVK